MHASGLGLPGLGQAHPCCSAQCYPPAPDLPCAGTPLKPTVTAAAGGSTLVATISFIRTFTATSYVTELTDVNVEGSTITDTLAVLDTEAGPWTRTLTATAKGTYRFTVCVGWVCKHALVQDRQQGGLGRAGGGS